MLVRIIQQHFLGFGIKSLLVVYAGQFIVGVQVLCRPAAHMAVTQHPEGALMPVIPVNVYAGYHRAVILVVPVHDSHIQKYQHLRPGACQNHLDYYRGPLISRTVPVLAPCQLQGSQPLVLTAQELPDIPAAPDIIHIQMTVCHHILRQQHSQAGYITIGKIITY